MGGKSFLKGAAVLALAGMAAHVIGALYRIPLTNIIGVEGVGLYQLCYPVYGLLLTFSTAGIPGAISKMVSERLARNDVRNARRVFHVSFWLLAFIGLASAAAVALGSPKIAAFIARDSGKLVQPAMAAVAPALFFVSALTAYRGYFQGRQQMIPTAASQILEQVVKIVPGFFIAAALMRLGPQGGAAGAMWGVALSEAVALIFLMSVYAASWHREKSRSEAGRMPGDCRYPPEPAGRIAGKLLRLALPMMAGAVFLPLASLADAAIVVNRLTDLGYAKEATQALYGILAGMVNVLVNVPGVLSLSICTSLIPSVAESLERGDARAVERKSRLGVKAALLIALPSAVGLAALARPILDLLYGATLSPEQLQVGGELLALSAAGVVFLSVVQATNGVLQGIGKVMVPMASLAVGAALKIALNYFLVGIPQVNITGAPLGTLLCYLIPTVINLAFVRKFTGMKPDAAGMLIRPGLAALCMGVCAWLMSACLPGLIGASAATVVAVLASIPLYLVFAALFGAIGKEELSLLPKGDKIALLLGRLGLQGAGPRNRP